jgi:hypothetical protein
MWPVAITAAIGLGIGLVLRFTSGGSPVGWSMVATLVALPLVGLLITIDDDLPGGWSNPDGKVRASWLYWENWAEVASRGAISGVGFAIDVGWYTAQALPLWIMGASGIGITVVLHRRIDRQFAMNAQQVRLDVDIERKSTSAMDC